MHRKINRLEVLAAQVLNLGHLLDSRDGELLGHALGHGLGANFLAFGGLLRPVLHTPVSHRGERMKKSCWQGSCCQHGVWKLKKKLFILSVFVFRDMQKSLIFFISLG